MSYKSICKDYKLFIDTCSLLDNNFDNFFSNIKHELLMYNNKIIIPYGVVVELERHKNQNSNLNLSKQAKYVLKILNHYHHKKKYIEIRGDKSENFADNIFLSVFTKFRLQHNLLLITQDNNLAQSIVNLREAPCVQNIKKIRVLRINNRGELEYFSWQKRKPIQDEGIDKFKLCNQVTPITDKPIRITHIPSIGDTILSQHNGTIKLAQHLGSGGEGDVYKTNTQYIAKIYKQGKLTLRKQKKLELMVSKKINCQGICYPVDLLYLNKEFVGYLMPQAKGEVLQTSVFIKPRMMELFPDWKRINLVELAVEVLNKIQYLHDRNIILGDINPMNIHVVSSKEIYFVDTDSYQIEDFPCPVGTVNFTAPELQGKKYENYLRTFGNEYFAIATLLFMIMLPGKTPYAQQGGGSPVENIRGMDFPYPFAGTRGGVPDGPWRFCWSHLTHELKRSFYETFMKWENMPSKLKTGGPKALENHSSEQTRYDTMRWLEIFKRYQGLLSSGKFAEQDPMSEDIFPTRFKKVVLNSYSR